MSIAGLLVPGIASLMWVAPVAVALFSQRPADVPAASPDPQIAAASHEVSAARIQPTNHQHQNVRTENGIEQGDMPKFVECDYTANAALNAATPASLASAPAPPANGRLLTKEMQNDSTIVWYPSPGGSHPNERTTGARPGSGLATGQEVLWRDRAVSDWQHARQIGNWLLCPCRSAES